MLVLKQLQEAQKEVELSCLCSGGIKAGGEIGSGFGGPPFRVVWSFATLSVSLRGKSAAPRAYESGSKCSSLGVGLECGIEPEP